MKGNTVKITIGLIIIGAIAIFVIGGSKYGWGDGWAWAALAFAVLVGGGFLFNKISTRNK